MSGRLNPREYDLGELRDAARRTRQDGSIADPADGDASDGRESGSSDGEPAESTDGDSVEHSDRAPAESSGGGPGESSGGGPGESSGDGPGEPSGDERSSSTVDSDRPAGTERREASRWSGHQSAGRRERPASTRGDSTLDVGLLARLSRQSVGRPYLARLPDEYSAQVEIFEWLEGLLATTGRDGALDALAYYESIGWLSERSHDHLVDFLDGLPTGDAADTRPLTVDDHRESLQYVARLAHRQA